MNPILGALAAFVGCTAIGRIAGVKLGYPGTGTAAGVVGGLIAGNYVGNMLTNPESSPNIVPNVVKESAVEQSKAASKAARSSVKRTIAGISAGSVDMSAPVTSMTEVVTEGADNARRALASTFTGLIAPLTAPLATRDSRYIQTSARRQESRDGSTFLFNPRTLRPR